MLQSIIFLLKIFHCIPITVWWKHSCIEKKNPSFHISICNLIYQVWASTHIYEFAMKSILVRNALFIEQEILSGPLVLLMRDKQVLHSYPVPGEITK